MPSAYQAMGGNRRPRSWMNLAIAPPVPPLYVRFKKTDSVMNTKAQKSSGLFYPIIIGMAIVAAFILTPITDFLTLIFSSLITVTGSLLAGFILSRGIGVRLQDAKSSLICAIIVSAVGSSLSFFGAHYLTLLF